MNKERRMIHTEGATIDTKTATGSLETSGGAMAPGMKEIGGQVVDTKHPHSVTTGKSEVHAGGVQVDVETKNMSPAKVNVVENQPAKPVAKLPVRGVAKIGRTRVTVSSNVPVNFRVK